MIRAPLHTRGARLLRRWFRVCAGLALIVNFCPSALSQTAPGPDAKLLSVTETGSKNYSTAQVMALSGLQTGAMINRDGIQAGADRLGHSGLFSSVRYSFTGETDGVRVIFQLQDAPTFPVSFDNFPWFTDEELSAALNQAGVPFSGKAPAAGTVLDTMAQALEKTLATRGVHGTVSHQMSVFPGTEQRTLQFSVQGADLTVNAVQFTDPLATNDRGVRDELQTLVGKPFSREAVERFDFEHVRPIYLSHAYLNVQFGRPEARFSGDPRAPLPKSVVVIVPITPGAAYTWGGITWSGNHAYTTSDLNTLVAQTGLTAGQAADGMKIQAMLQSIETAYGHRGYLDASIVPKKTFDESAHRASYQVDISEGEQYRMGNLVLTGLSVDAERRVQQAWHIPQGQVFDKTFFDYFLSQGIANALKGMAAAQDKVGHYLQKNPKPATVDVMLDFE